jgi:hypothetical protein
MGHLQLPFALDEINCPSMSSKEIVAKILYAKCGPLTVRARLLHLQSGNVLGGILR